MRHAVKRAFGALIARTDPRARMIVLGASVISLALTAFGACRGSKDSATPADASVSAPAASKASGRSEPRDSGAEPSHRLLWEAARDGDVEDLAVLATAEGAAGLVEAGADGARRATAIRAMAYARGWAQLPFLAKAASGKDEGEALLAIEATSDLAARPRLSEDPEDLDELRDGCAGIVALAKDTAQGRKRRVGALRALRMLPCPPAELPTDLDAK